MCFLKPLQTAKLREFVFEIPSKSMWCFAMDIPKNIVMNKINFKFVTSTGIFQVCEICCAFL